MQFVNFSLRIYQYKIKKSEIDFNANTRTFNPGWKFSFFVDGSQQRFLKKIKEEIYLYLQLLQK